jgi:hypothetical protein
LQPEYRDTWHHFPNRTAGAVADRPMDEADKEQFIRLLRN